MSPNEKLTSFLMADQAPAFDPGFIAGLEERMARDRLLSRLWQLAVLAIAIGAVCFGLAMASGPQVLATAFSGMDGVIETPGLLLAAIIVAAGVYLPRILPRALIR
ncbi:hypothetical protein V0U79_00080 [Hyphobacterium sp. HN65]|uniref:Uncharacterized protein n=1 Tax=Hyphobacterium lacteum TaxID=3116575 RepID=A0ABU7LLI0_9PROT|nr:hypothetical protein [Hyphobacterium sp. HN65]MEE2524747.1 hypothetical protein [Hyphobacterium sp. HN65]